MQRCTAPGKKGGPRALAGLPQAAVHILPVPTSSAPSPTPLLPDVPLLYNCSCRTSRLRRAIQAVRGGGRTCHCAGAQGAATGERRSVHVFMGEDQRVRRTAMLPVVLGLAGLQGPGGCV